MFEYFISSHRLKHLILFWSKKTFVVRLCLSGKFWFWLWATKTDNSVRIDALDNSSSFGFIRSPRNITNYKMGLKAIAVLQRTTPKWVFLKNNVTFSHSHAVVLKRSKNKYLYLYHHLHHYQNNYQRVHYVHTAQPWCGCRLCATMSPNQVGTECRTLETRVLNGATAIVFPSRFLPV